VYSDGVCGVDQHGLRFGLWGERLATGVHLPPLDSLSLPPLLLGWFCRHSDERVDTVSHLIVKKMIVSSHRVGWKRSLRNLHFMSNPTQNLNRAGGETLRNRSSVCMRTSAIGTIIDDWVDPTDS
jgi:hypothetical protein